MNETFSLDRSREGKGQYGGGVRARWLRAASVHPARSSGKFGKACTRAAPPSPVGSPARSSAWAMLPTSRELEITTIPISDRMPRHESAERTPEKRPAE